MHWDGDSWELTRIYYKRNGNLSIIIPIRGIWVINQNNIWLAAGSIFHWDGNDAQLSYRRDINTSEVVEKLWYESNVRIFGVGNLGLIVQYNGSTWEKIESGTDLQLTDIWGLSENDIYAVGADMSSRDNVVLHYNGSSWEKLPTDQNRKVGVWGTATDNLYFVGDGIFRLEGDSLCKLEPPVNIPKYFMEKVRGTAANNMFIVGHFGFVVHYNGSTWKYYTELYRYAIASSVAVNANSVLVVGTDGARAFIYHGRRMD